MTVVFLGIIIRSCGRERFIIKTVYLKTLNIQAYTSKGPLPQASLLETHSTAGIPGHITALGHEPHQYVTFYIQVEDIHGMLNQVEAAGGKKLVGPVPLPDGKKFAWFNDPGGNMVGLVTKG